MYLLSDIYYYLIFISIFYYKLYNTIRLLSSKYKSQYYYLSSQIYVLIIIMHENYY